MASFLAKEQFAAFFSMLTLDDLFYIIPVGLSIPMMSLIGNAAGAGDKQGVKNNIKATLYIAFGVFLLELLIFAIF